MSLKSVLVFPLLTLNKIMLAEEGLSHGCFRTVQNSFLDEEYCEQVVKSMTLKNLKNYQFQFEV